jgi:hypothetical protein
MILLSIIAGLTYGDPILRTGNPLSVELGPGKLLPILINSNNFDNYFRYFGDNFRWYLKTTRNNC